jgi:hypothetical protein
VPKSQPSLRSPADRSKAPCGRSATRSRGAPPVFVPFDVQLVMHAERQAQGLLAIPKRILRDLASLLTAAVQEILDRHSPVVPCSAVVCYGLTMLLSRGGESASTADEQLRRTRTNNGEETS